MAKFGWVCPGVEGQPAHDVPVGGLTGDHIKSRAEHPELALVASNFQALCGVCNSRKGSGTARGHRRTGRRRPGHARINPALTRNPTEDDLRYDRERPRPT